MTITSSPTTQSPMTQISKPRSNSMLNRERRSSACRLAFIGNISSRPSNYCRNDPIQRRRCMAHLNNEVRLDRIRTGFTVFHNESKRIARGKKDIRQVIHESHHDFRSSLQIIVSVGLFGNNRSSSDSGSWCKTFIFHRVGTLSLTIV